MPTTLPPSLLGKTCDHCVELTSDSPSIVAMVVVSCHDDYDVKQALTVLKSRIALRDLNDGLHYDIIKFFHKRSTCQCLEKLYLQERAKSRRALCNYCKVRKERSQLYLCSACLYFYYCSEECQAAAWPDHQEKCNALRGRGCPSSFHT